MHHYDAVVQIGHAVTESGLAESCRGGLPVDHLSVDSKACVHFIQIAISPRPEMQSIHHLLRTHNACLALVQCNRSRGESRQFGTVAVNDFHAIYKSLFLSRLVPHLRLGMYSSLASSYVVVFGIDVSTCCSKGGVERESLIEAVCHMQFHVFGQSAVVGVEVFVVPLEGSRT